MQTMQGKKIVASLAVGLAAGLTVASLVGIPYLAGPASIPALLSNAFTFWGVFFGIFTALLAAGIVFAILNRRERTLSRWGRWIAGVTLVVFAVATLWWVAMWGFSPFSLEGLWIYPLAIATAAGAIALLKPRRPRMWDEPGPPVDNQPFIR
jgi:hypothetical protein